MKELAVFVNQSPSAASTAKAIFRLGCALTLACLVCCPALHAQQPAKQRGVDDLLKVIRTGNTDERAEALLEMTALDTVPEKALADVIKIMRAPNEAEKVYAAVILGKIGKPAIAQLTTLLEDKDEVVRFYALWSVALIGQSAKNLAPAVLKAMRDSDADVRCKAAFALRRIGVPANQAVPALIAALRDKDELARDSAADAVVEYGKDAAPVLIPLLKDREIGWQVPLILERIGPNAKAAIPALCEHMDRWPSHNDSGISNLLLILGKDGYAEFAEVMKSKNPIARAYALTGLVNSGSRERELLISALNDTEPRVRIVAAYRLYSIPSTDKEQLAILRRAMFDAEPEVRLNVVEAVFKFDRDAEAYVRDCWKSRKGRDQIIAAGILMAKVPRERNQWMAVLTAKLKDADVDVQFEAALELTRPWEFVDDGTWLRDMWAKHSRSVLPILVERLRDEKAVNRHEAASAIQSLRWRILPDGAKAALDKAFADVLPDLCKALKSSDRRLRLQALGALKDAVPIEKKYPPDLFRTDGSGSLPDYDYRADVKTTLPAIVPLLKDPDRDIRMAALNVLSTFGPDAVPHFPALIADQDVEILFMALNELFHRKISAKKAIPAMRELAKKHEETEYFGFFVHFLTEFDQAESFSFLVGAMAKKNTEIRQALEDAGEKVVTTKTVAALQKQVGSADRDVAVRAAQALAAISEYIPEDDLYSMRTMMIKTLRAKMPAVEKAMQSKDAEVRRAAVKLVYELRTAIGSVRFRRVLAGDDNLGKLDANIREILEEAFRDPDLEVRRTMRMFLRPIRNSSTSQ